MNSLHLSVRSYNLIILKNYVRENRYGKQIILMIFQKFIYQFQVVTTQIYGFYIQYLNLLVLI